MRPVTKILYSCVQKVGLPTSVWLVDVNIMNGFGAGRGELCHWLTPVRNGGVDGGDSSAAPCATTTWDRGGKQDALLKENTLANQ